MKSVILLSIFWLSSLITANGEKKYGSFSQAFFKADKNVNFEEGTYEVWFKHDFQLKDDFQKDPDYPVSTISLFHFRDKYGNKSFRRYPYLRLMTADAKVGHIVRLGTNLALDRNGTPFTGKTVTFESLNWGGPEWHYIGLSWKKNGKKYDFVLKCDSSAQTFSFDVSDEPLELSAKDLLFCISEYGAGRGFLDSVKISKKALSENEMEDSYKNGLKKDKNTTIFLTGKDFSRLRALNLSREDITDMERDRAKKKLSISSKGAIFRKTSLVDGKFNDKAAKLYGN